jgi:ubiquinone/menaquinone biosynthesis C-methylase UbiE
MSDISYFTDKDYLITDQYRDASNLNARITLHRRFSTSPYDWMKWLFEHLRVPQPGRLLELGCGPGDLWVDNLGRMPESWHVVLSDLSPKMVHQARSNLAVDKERFDFCRIDAQALPFPSRFFDAVIANFMLYHVPDRPRALGEIQRVLKPGGRLYAATNGRDHMRQVREMIHALDPGASFETAADHFGLENGAEQLRVFFTRVRCHDYEDGLMVTEVDPLVAYILSTKRSALLEEDSEPLVRLIERDMAAQGAIHISKRSGLFEAVKGDG